MEKTNVLLMWGGAGSEHEISALSAGYIEQSLLSMTDINLLRVELVAQRHYVSADGNCCQFIKNIDNGCSEVVFSDSQLPAWPVDFVIPCFHGFPGETGDIQSMLELMDVPYMGCGAEASRLCFNKVSTKLWLNALAIPNTPFIILTDDSATQLERANEALAKWQRVFVKASSQGSSVGCYKVDEPSMLESAVHDAFKHSPYVLIEQCLQGRELEVSVYEYGGEVIATAPGEIHCPEDSFYTYDEKYSDDSGSTTDIVAKNITPEQISMIQRYATGAFTGLKLQDLSRIDFFLTIDNKIYINEINTFPGMTPISMFPKMMINHGHAFDNYLAEVIRKHKNKK